MKRERERERERGENCIISPLCRWKRSDKIPGEFPSTSIRTLSFKDPRAQSSLLAPLRLCGAWNPFLHRMPAFSTLTLFFFYFAFIYQDSIPPEIFKFTISLLLMTPSHGIHLSSKMETLYSNWSLNNSEFLQAVRSGIDAFWVQNGAFTKLRHQGVEGQLHFVFHKFSRLNLWWRDCKKGVVNDKKVLSLPLEKEHYCDLSHSFCTFMDSF